MAKQCKIYYGKVVDDGGAGWAGNGSCSMEPIKVEGREPLGKDPEFCCAELENEVKNYTIDFYYRQGVECGFHIIAASPGQTIRFCPFCGAQIVFKEHLKLQVIETPITSHIYHYEVAKGGNR